MKSITLIPFLMVLVSLPVSSNQSKIVYDFFKNLKSYETVFHQTTYENTSITSKTSSGKFYLDYPGKFRWDYQTPYEFKIIADGQKIWLYDPDLEQVTLKPQNQALEGSAGLLLSGTTSIKDNYTINFMGYEGDKSWFELKPISQKNTNNFQRIRLAMKNNLLFEMELQDQLGQVTLIVFSEIKYNLPVNAHNFSFVPPKGIDIIE